MARHISADSTGYVYRAVVEVRYSEEHNIGPKVFTETYGPYTNKGTATAQLTRVKRRYSRFGKGPEVTGKVQSAYLKDWVDTDG